MKKVIFITLTKSVSQFEIQGACVFASSAFPTKKVSCPPDISSRHRAGVTCTLAWLACDFHEDTSNFQDEIGKLTSSLRSHTCHLADSSIPWPTIIMRR